MNLNDRLEAIRHELGRHREHCDGLGEIEDHLDQMQAEIEQILARLPRPDHTPAHITLTAS